MRYHGLDGLRAFAMLMGVVLHASMFYVEGIGAELGYELTGRILIPTSETLGLIFTFIHVWRMPLFLLLAGFFARLIVQRRGTANLLRNRFVRIVIPLVGGMLVYNLIFQFGGINKLHHLWFLYDLVWMYILVICMKYVSRIWPRIAIKIDWIFGSPARLLWLVIPLVPATIIGRPMFFNVIHDELGPSGPFFILGFTYFLIGWFLHRNSQVLPMLALKWKLYFPLGIVSFCVYMVALVLVFEGGRDAGLIWAFGMVIASVTTLLLIMGFIGGSQALFQRSNIWIRYFVDASYWIYLLHLVVVFAVGAAILRNTFLDPIIAVLVNIVVTTFICTATYHVLVRYTPIGWVLHGRREHL